MKRETIVAEIEREKRELAAAIEECKELGCFVDEQTFMRNRNDYTVKQATAHIKMYATISEVNYLQRQLCKKDKVEFTNDMLCHKGLFA